MDRERKVTVMRRWWMDKGFGMHGAHGKGRLTMDRGPEKSCNSAVAFGQRVARKTRFLQD